MTDEDSPLRWSCPMCGADPGDPCMPLRKTKHPFTLGPHPMRGASAMVLERDGYQQLPSGLWRKRRRPAAGRK